MKAPLPSEICPEAPVRNDSPSSTIDIAAPVARLKFVLELRKNVMKIATSRASSVNAARDTTGWLDLRSGRLSVVTHAIARSKAMLSATPSRVVAALTRERTVATTATTMAIGARRRVRSSLIKRASRFVS